MGRQEIQQPSPVEISLSEMSPFISDVPQAQLQPQVCQSSFAAAAAVSFDFYITWVTIFLENRNRSGNLTAVREKPVN